jgi:hypothetical protein
MHVLEASFLQVGLKLFGLAAAVAAAFLSRLETKLQGKD